MRPPVSPIHAVEPVAPTGKDVRLPKSMQRPKRAPLKVTMQKNISIKGAREHNLKNVDVEIPRDTLTVITVSVSRGISTSTVLRLCSRAPLMEMFFCISTFSAARLGRGKRALFPVGRAGSTAVILGAEAFMWAVLGGCASCAAERGKGEDSLDSTPRT